LKFYPTKRVKTSFAVSFELEFVRVIHAKPGRVWQNVYRVVHFGVVGDKPVDDAERDNGLALLRGDWLAVDESIEDAGVDFVVVKLH